MEALEFRHDILPSWLAAIIFGLVVGGLSWALRRALIWRGLTISWAIFSTVVALVIIYSAQPRVRHVQELT